MAGIGGHPEILELLLDRNCDFPEDFFLRTARAGHVECLKVVEKLGIRKEETEYERVVGACLGNNKSVADFILESSQDKEQALWLQTIFGDSRNFGVSGINIAAFDNDFYILAAAAGRLDILEYAEKNFLRGKWFFPEIFAAALMIPNLEVLTWLLDLPSLEPVCVMDCIGIGDSIPKNFNLFVARTGISESKFIRRLAEQGGTKYIKLFAQKKLFSKPDAGKIKKSNVKFFFTSAARSNGPTESLGSIKLLKWAMREVKQFNNKITGGNPGNPEYSEKLFPMPNPTRILIVAASRKDLKVFRWVLKTFFPGNQFPDIGPGAEIKLDMELGRNLNLEKYLWLQYRNIINPGKFLPSDMEKSYIRSLQLGRYLWNSGDTMWCHNWSPSEPEYDNRLEDFVSEALQSCEERDFQ
jgi:hypothetical protein